jgi:hypothetical protein
MGSFVNESDPPPITRFGKLLPDVPALENVNSELVDEFTLADHNNSRVPLITLSMKDVMSAGDEVLSVTKDEAMTFSIKGDTIANRTHVECHANHPERRHADDFRYGSGEKCSDEAHYRRRGVQMDR